MNSYATAAIDAKDSIACLQSYHRGSFVDYSRLYQPSQSSAAAYLDQYRLQQSAYPASVTEHAAGPYSVGGKTTASAGYDPTTAGYGFFDLHETFRRDQWPLLGSAAVQDGASGPKRLDSGGEKTGTAVVSRPCGGTGSDGERPALAIQGGSSGALTDSVQIKCEDGVRRPETTISHHHHHHSQQQQQHASSRPVVPGCSPNKHHHSKHAADPIKSSKGITYKRAQFIYK